MSDEREIWSEPVGLIPHKVTAYENLEKGGVLYLRWRANGNWKKRSLGVTLPEKGNKAINAVKQMALREAEAQYEILSGKRIKAGAPVRALAIGQAWAAISDPKTGKYPTVLDERTGRDRMTLHAKDVKRALADAARIWAAETAWNTIDRARIRMLGRTRVDELLAKAAAMDDCDRKAHMTGLRGAIVTVQRVLGVATWLRDENLIEDGACIAPKYWQAELREYWQQITEKPLPSEEDQPRYTLEEMRALLAKAPEVDPRFALLVALGAELRLGQVRRCRRSDLKAEFRTLRVRGDKKKRGEVIELTRGQWAAWETARDGYLSDLEAGVPDYFLFPAGKLRAGKAVLERQGETGKPIDRSAVRDWWLECEDLAEIAHVAGRAAYGVKRRNIDELKDREISREGIKASTGTSAETADKIYASKESEKARKEAAAMRAKIRGEA